VNNVKGVPIVPLVIVSGAEIVQIPVSVDTGRLDIHYLKEKLGNQSIVNFVSLKSMIFPVDDF
jgi:hypothetical protein